MSRNEGESAGLRRRPARTVPSLVVGILLLAIGVGLAWLCIARLVSGSWSTLLQAPRNQLATLTWSDPLAWSMAAVAVAVGLILLLCALVPGGFNTLRVRSSSGEETGRGDVQAQSGNPGQQTVMTRRGVAHLARAQCVQVDGVSTASVTVTAKKVHLKVGTSLRETKDLHTLVTDGVRNRLTAIGLDPVPEVTATIESRG